MARRAHNSSFPERIEFKRKSFVGPSAIFHSASPRPAVSLQGFTTRLRKFLVRDGGLSDSTIREALYTTADEFKSRYLTRQSWIEVEGERINVGNFYQKNQDIAEVSYKTFRARVKRQSDSPLDLEKLNHAVSMKTAEWIAFYGGGRRRPFTYKGDAFGEQYGKRFNSIAAFLITVGKGSDRPLVWSRLKSGWDLDDALTVCVSRIAEGGLIYKITRNSNGQIYIGLTNGGVEARWDFHIHAAKKGARNRFACAIREDGPEGFSIEILEDGIETDQALKEREIYWIDKFEALGAGGLNTMPGGGLGGLRGRKVLYEGEEFPSLKDAARILGERLDVNPWIVETRIRAGERIPLNPRVHSNHPDAGSNLFRRWKGMLKRHPKNVCSKWLDYQSFKDDVASWQEDGYDLVRINRSLEWGPENFRWVTPQERVEEIHGTSIIVFGRKFPSIESLAAEYEIGTSTLKDRVRRQGMSFEEAVSQDISPNHKRRAVTIGDKTFRSKNQAAKFLVEAEGISFGKARYRIDRGDFD